MSSEDSFRLEGDVAIVTGAAAGIGRAIAETFVGAGAAVVVTDLKKEGADVVASAIARSGGKALGIECDVTNEAHRLAIVDAGARIFGKVSILVNNAGGGGPKPFDMPMSDFEWPMTSTCFPVSSDAARRAAYA